MDLCDNYQESFQYDINPSSWTHNNHIDIIESDNIMKYEFIRLHESLKPSINPFTFNNNKNRVIKVEMKEMEFNDKSSDLYEKQLENNRLEMDEKDLEFIEDTNELFKLPLDFLRWTEKNFEDWFYWIRHKLRFKFPKISKEIIKFNKENPINTNTWIEKFGPDAGSCMHEEFSKLVKYKMLKTKSDTGRKHNEIMNLAFLNKYNDKHVPIRIIGEISCYSFELLDSDDYLEVSVKESEVVFYINNNNRKTIYFSESINCDLALNTILSKNQLITIEEPIEINCVFSYSDLKNSDSFTTPVVTFTPLNCDYKELFKLILSVDLLLFLPSDCQLSDISKAAIFGINDQIFNFKRAYSFLNADMKCRKIRKLIPLNFQINKDILTIILPEIELDKEEIWRKEISNGLYLEKTLQRCQSLYPSNDVLVKLTGNGNKLISPHKKIKVIYPENYLVIGRYTYYHYMQDNFNDKGWGCAYRSLQTIVSWFIWQGWTKIDIPNHRDIQTSLVKIGDKEKSLINSHSWIGSFEISLVLQELLKIESRIISLNAGSDLVGIYDQLQEHFVECGAPVMIGGGQLAHTIIGVSKDSTSKIRFLILDPHYTGSPTDITNILGKGWCGWKELSFWKENVPYNLCLPLLPK